MIVNNSHVAKVQKFYDNNLPCEIEIGTWHMSNQVQNSML